MRYILKTLFIFCCVSAIRAQSSVPLLSAGNHSSLDSVKVSYQSIPTTTLNASAIYVKAEVMVKLKEAATADKIFLQVFNRKNDSLVYSVHYELSEAAAGPGNQAMFFVQGRRFHILCPTTVPLNTYIYKIYTQSAQGTNSSTFTTRQ